MYPFLDSPEFKINEIENLKDRPLEYIINFFKIIYEKIALIKVEFIYEVPFKYRAIWEEINTFRLGIIESLKPIIKKAQKQGLIKKNINVDFFLFLFASIAQNVFTPEVFIEYDFSIKESLALLLEIMFNASSVVVISINKNLLLNASPSLNKNVLS